MNLSSRKKLIDDLQHAKNKLEIYNFILDNYPLSSIYSFFEDENGMIVYAIAEGEEMKKAGFTKDWVVGRTLEEVFEEMPKEYDILYPLYKKAVENTGDDAHSIIEHTFNDMRYRQVFMNIKNDTDMKIGMLVSINITEYHEMNEQMLAIAWEASHGMRGVVARIMGLTNLLDVEFYKKLPHGSKQYFNMLKREANNLDSKIHDIVKKTEIAKESYEVNRIKNS